MRKFTRVLMIGLIAMTCFVPSVYGNGNTLYDNGPYPDPSGEAYITNGPYCQGPWGNYVGGGGRGKAIAYGILTYHTKTEVRSTLMSGLDGTQKSNSSGSTVVTVNHDSCAVEVTVSDLRNDVRATVYWEDASGAHSRFADTSIVVSP